jgi:hypothetical protein
MASGQGVKFMAETILDVASAADSIVNYADSKKADLIVIGTKGRTGLKRLLLGSVASGNQARIKNDAKITLLPLVTTISHRY